MIKINKISTKIKLLGALLLFLMLSVIAITIYLNQKNEQDALTINIAGKQRMLTQRISKNIFYIQHNPKESFEELDSACDEFKNGLKTLKYGNKLQSIENSTLPNVLKQLNKVTSEWESFYALVLEFKKSDLNDEKTKIIVDNIYKQNNTLLDSVDTLVTLYTKDSEEKTRFVKTFQYISALVLLLLFAYSLAQLKTIESHADAFMQYSKMLTESENLSDITPMNLQNSSEDEIVEVGDAINTFIQKINLAVECSNEAIKQSQSASNKLEELTEEFDSILGELQDKSLSSKYLNNSEDIVIESTENLIISTKKLTNLKKELESLALSCKNIS